MINCEFSEKGNGQLLYDLADRMVLWRSGGFPYRNSWLSTTQLLNVSVYIGILKQVARTKKLDDELNILSRNRHQNQLI